MLFQKVVQNILQFYATLGSEECALKSMILVAIRDFSNHGKREITGVHNLAHDICCSEYITDSFINGMSDNIETESDSKLKISEVIGEILLACVKIGVVLPFDALSHILDALTKNSDKQTRIFAAELLLESHDNLQSFHLESVKSFFKDSVPDIRMYTQLAFIKGVWAISRRLPILSVSLDHLDTCTALWSFHKKIVSDRDFSSELNGMILLLLQNEVSKPSTILSKTVLSLLALILRARGAELKEVLGLLKTYVSSRCISGILIEELDSLLRSYLSPGIIEIIEEILTSLILQGIQVGKGAVHWYYNHLFSPNEEQGSSDYLKRLEVLMKLHTNQNLDDNIFNRLAFHVASLALLVQFKQAPLNKCWEVFETYLSNSGPIIMYAHLVVDQACENHPTSRGLKLLLMMARAGKRIPEDQLFAVHSKKGNVIQLATRMLQNNQPVPSSIAKALLKKSKNSTDELDFILEYSSRGGNFEEDTIRHLMEMAKQQQQLIKPLVLGMQNSEISAELGKEVVESFLRFSEREGSPPLSLLYSGIFVSLSKAGIKLNDNQLNGMVSSFTELKAASTPEAQQEKARISMAIRNVIGIHDCSDDLLKSIALSDILMIELHEEFWYTLKGTCSADDVCSYIQTSPQLFDRLLGTFLIKSVKVQVAVEMVGTIVKSFILPKAEDLEWEERFKRGLKILAYVSVSQNEEIISKACSVGIHHLLTHISQSEHLLDERTITLLAQNCRLHKPTLTHLTEVLEPNGVMQQVRLLLRLQELEIGNFENLSTGLSVLKGNIHKCNVRELGINLCKVWSDLTEIDDIKNYLEILSIVVTQYGLSFSVKELEMFVNPCVATLCLLNENDFAPDFLETITYLENRCKALSHPLLFALHTKIRVALQESKSHKPSLLKCAEVVTRYVELNGANMNRYEETLTTLYNNEEKGQTRYWSLKGLQTLSRTPPGVKISTYMQTFFATAVSRLEAQTKQFKMGAFGRWLNGLKRKLKKDEPPSSSEFGILQVLALVQTWDLESLQNVPQEQWACQILLSDFISAITQNNAEKLLVLNKFQSLTRSWNFEETMEILVKFLSFFEDSGVPYPNDVIDVLYSLEILSKDAIQIHLIPQSNCTTPWFIRIKQAALCNLTAIGSHGNNATMVKTLQDVYQTIGFRPFFHLVKKTKGPIDPQLLQQISKLARKFNLPKNTFRQAGEKSLPEMLVLIKSLALSKLCLENKCLNVKVRERMAKQSIEILNQSNTDFDNIVNVLKLPLDDATSLPSVICMIHDNRLGNTVVEEIIKVCKDTHETQVVQKVSDLINLHMFPPGRTLKTAMEVIDEYCNSYGNSSNTKLKEKLTSVFETIGDGTRKSTYFFSKTPISEWNNNDILSWARTLRTVGTKLQVDDGFTAEALCVARRAFFLLTGFILTPVQILAIYTGINKGLKARFLQVATGSGKSAITAILSAIYALRQKSVDVYTSSPVLAERDAQTWQEFFTMFGLTCSHNGESSSPYVIGIKACYKADIVYGETSNFQFDILRDGYSGLGTLGGRRGQVAIVDEADSQLIDDVGKLARLSSPIPGMDLLQIFYHLMWNRLCLVETKLAISNQEGKFATPSGLQRYETLLKE